MSQIIVNVTEEDIRLGQQRAVAPRSYSCPIARAICRTNPTLDPDVGGSKGYLRTKDGRVFRITKKAQRFMDLADKQTVGLESKRKLRPATFRFTER